MNFLKVASLLTLLLIPYPSFSQTANFNYGTNSEAARKAYLRGWEEILDLGQWTKAEASYREAVQLDPDFQLAWAQVGRISNDPAERALIFAKLKAIAADSTLESKLLKVYLGSLELIDTKDRGLMIEPAQVKQFYQNSLENFGALLKRYPKEIYVRAEYIEVIHGIHGAAAALDSIQSQVNLGMEISPFLISYKSQLWAELKEFDKAAEALEELKKCLSGIEAPAISFTAAILQAEKSEWSQANKSVDQTLFLDPKHTLARRLKTQLEAHLKNEKN